MPLPPEAIEREVERFRDLTRTFREKVTGGDTPVGEGPDRERIYGILVSINDFLEDKLRQA